MISFLQASVPRPARTDPAPPRSTSDVPEAPASPVQEVRRRVYVAEVDGELYAVR